MANSLVEDLDSFLELEKYMDAVKERESSRKALLDMLNLIAEILNYVCNFVPSGISGIYYLLHYSIPSLSLLKRCVGTKLLEEDSRL